MCNVANQNYWELNFFMSLNELFTSLGVYYLSSQKQTGTAVL